MEEKGKPTQPNLSPLNNRIQAASYLKTPIFIASLESKKTYFASDLHLGSPDLASSLQRERHFVAWLDRIKADADALYLMGDVFDFWFEYHKAVPKGYVRILGKLAELQDLGIPIIYFTGNHDLWLSDYFTTQFGAEIIRDPILREVHGKLFYLAHGDGLGPGDHGYKFMKWVFRNPLAQWAFHRLHPNFGIGLADYLSRRSRRKTGHKDAIDHGDQEYLYIHAQEVLKKKPEIDYFVFGHRHFPKYRSVGENTIYINLGDWMRYYTFLEVDDLGARLMAMPMGGTDTEPYPAPGAASP